jgi:hypothetical protein
MGLTSGQSPARLRAAPTPGPPRVRAGAHLLPRERRLPHRVRPVRQRRLEPRRGGGCLGVERLQHHLAQQRGVDQGQQRAVAQQPRPHLPQLPAARLGVRRARLQAAVGWGVGLEAAAWR